jgi:putative addiction module killer protein
MYTIKLTPVFEAWMAGIKDKVTRIRLARRLDKAQRGNLGDIKSLGGGLFEMREHFGPGWRMYYLQREETLIVMLGGGDKSSQAADISKAVTIAATIEE